MRSERLHLADMLDAIDAIERFTARCDENCFLTDELIQSAVLQKLSIVGEAAARLSPETRGGAADVPWKEIIGFRNVAVHVYFSVDWRIVYVTIKDDLPGLRAKIASMLGTT